MTVRAIDTFYCSHLFRSRLEARWAVFFNSLPVPYEYEKEGFQLRHGWYLPDFWLPGQDCWLEVKPAPPNENERHLARDLAESTGKRVFIFWGQLPNPTALGADGREDSRWGNESGWLFGSEDMDQKWCQCAKCGRFGIEYEARSARIGCGCYPESDREHNGNSVDIMASYMAARIHRFE